MDSKSFARAYVTATGDRTGLEDNSVVPGLETSYGEDTVIEDPVQSMIETSQELTKTTGAIEMAKKIYGGLEDTLIVDFDDKHVFDTEDVEEDVEGLYMTIEGAPGIDRAEEKGTDHTEFTNIIDGVIALSQQIPNWLN